MLSAIGLSLVFLVIIAMAYFIFRPLKVTKREISDKTFLLSQEDSKEQPRPLQMQSTYLYSTFGYLQNSDYPVSLIIFYLIETLFVYSQAILCL